MKRIVQCPKCESKLAVFDIGKPINQKCPRCGNAFEVQSEEKKDSADKAVDKKKSKKLTGADKPAAVADPAAADKNSATPTPAPDDVKPECRAESKADATSTGKQDGEKADDKKASDKPEDGNVDEKKAVSKPEDKKDADKKSDNDKAEAKKDDNKKADDSKGEAKKDDNKKADDGKGEDKKADGAKDAAAKKPAASPSASTPLPSLDHFPEHSHGVSFMQVLVLFVMLIAVIIAMIVSNRRIGARLAAVEQTVNTLKAQSALRH